MIKRQTAPTSFNRRCSCQLRQPAIRNSHKKNLDWNLRTATSGRWYVNISEMFFLFWSHHSCLLNLTTELPITCCIETFILQVSRCTDGWQNQEKQLDKWVEKHREWWLHTGALHASTKQLTASHTQLARVSLSVMTSAFRSMVKTLEKRSETVTDGSPLMAVMLVLVCCVRKRSESSSGDWDCRCRTRSVCQSLHRDKSLTAQMKACLRV